MRPTLAFNRERCLACLSCELACSLAHEYGRRVRIQPVQETALLRSRLGTEDAANAGRGMGLQPAMPASFGRMPAGTPAWQAGGSLHAQRLEALRCEQCGEPLCVFACKSGALQRDPLTGRVALDDSRCVGCFMCLMVCPSGVRPARDRVARCDVCEGRDVPACVTACPTGALSAGAAPERLAQSGFAGHVLVIGSSAAGIAACEAAREHAPNCSVTLVTADASPQYSRPLLSYVLAGAVEPSRIDWRARGYLEKLGVQVLAGRKAERLETPEEAGKLKHAPPECGHGMGTVALDDGTELGFDSLIVATGARGAKLSIPGADLAGVRGLRNIEDLEEISRLAEPGRRAVVLGGGNVGLQVAEALLARGLTVTAVAASSHLLSQMVDAEAARRVAELFRGQGLNIRTGRNVIEIGQAGRPAPLEITGAGHVEGVRLDDGEWIGADLVVVAKGIAPNIEWLRGSGVRIGRGVSVDLCGRTSAPGVFAAGDCAEAADPITGRASVSGVWPVAYEMGRAAGCAAVGVERPSAGALRMNASRFFDVSIVSIGEVRPERLEGASEEVLENNNGVYRKLVYCEERLAGALLYGDISGAGAFYRRYREEWAGPLPDRAPYGTGRSSGELKHAPQGVA